MQVQQEGADTIGDAIYMAVQLRGPFQARLHLSQVAGVEAKRLSAEFCRQAGETQLVPTCQQQMCAPLGEATTKRRTYPSVSSENHI